ncbi:hypothetical protein SAMN06295885_3675 [Rathayibacter oskolensis]|uniref:Uncharacterized protein n=1 Tax=Rathayibacter oskolensis TaxID=1891671 RepID=A0A1X7PI43_9MICO|nr:hypothetical protein [Rathayibacter oskolensis]SMH51031.1 hypothetical protein SAMN06295885_3675 [Rathayibacter oskolensis]
MAAVPSTFRSREPYICRGCGTEIMTPASYRKCPVCGIKYN